MIKETNDVAFIEGTAYELIFHFEKIISSGMFFRVIKKGKEFKKIPFDNSCSFLVNLSFLPDGDYYYQVEDVDGIYQSGRISVLPSIK